MGIVASFLAIITVIGVIAAGRYELAIVLPDNDYETWIISVIGISISLALGIITSIGFAVSHEWLYPILGLSEIPLFWTYLTGLIVFLLGFQNVLTKLAIKQRKFKSLAATQVIQKSCEHGGKIGLGFINFGASGLFIGTVTGYIVRCAKLSFHLKSFLVSKQIPSFQDIIHQACKYKKFPLISSWSSLFNNASIHVPVVLFTSFFSPAVAGYFSLSDRMLSLPAVFIGQNVASVFLERAAKTRNNPEELSRITLKIYKKLLFLSTITMSVITFYGDRLFPLAFGEEWTEAGKYAQWMSVWVVFQLASSPLSTIYSILGKQLEELAWQLSLFTVRLLPLIIFNADAYTTVIAFSCSSSIVYFLLCLRILSLSGISLITSLKETIINISPVIIIQIVIYFILAAYK